MIADALRRITKDGAKIDIYGGAKDGKVRKLDPSDGSTVWTSADFGSYAYGLACDPDGYVYVGTYNGNVRKLDPSDGSTLWTSADFGSEAYGITTNYYAGWGL